MRAELKGMYSPDVDLTDPVAVEAADALLVQLMIGPAGAPGEESFDLAVRVAEGHGVDSGGYGFDPAGRALVLDRIDMAVVRGCIDDFLRDLERPSWPELARAIGRITRWEFAGYRPGGEAGE